MDVESEEMETDVPQYGTYAPTNVKIGQDRASGALTLSHKSAEAYGFHDSCPTRFEFLIGLACSHLLMDTLILQINFRQILEEISIS